MTQRLALASLALALTAAPGTAQTLPDFPLPKAYWSFDLCDGARVLDDSQGVRGVTDATLSGGAACGAGRYGSGGRFDGLDDVAMAPDDARLRFGSRLTVSAWVKPDNVWGLRTIVNKWYVPDSYGLFLVDGNYLFSLALANGTYANASAAAIQGQWSHVAGVFDGQTAALYVNGVLRHSVPAAGTLQASSQPVAIGSHPSWNAFAGNIDEVKLFDVALGPSQVASLAVTPALGVRGLHLYANGYAASPYDSNYPRHRADYSRIQHIGNLNSVKTTVFSWVGEAFRNELQIYQRDKLTSLKAVTGNHTVWVLRAWPVRGTDLVNAADNPAANLYEQGRTFARNLLDVFWHLRSNLKQQHVYIEVANEPNIVDEAFLDASGRPSPAAYNEFFRGFYWGQREIGFDFPLVYAGLSPGGETAQRFNSDVWYSDYWVRYHIQNYAAKIGAHVYWVGALAPQGNTRLTDGKYYRRIRELLVQGGVSPRGILITEFNGQRTTFPGPDQAENQAVDACQWWREEAADAVAGYWVEQAMLWVTDADSPNDQTEYRLTDGQVDNIRNCR
jgi:hypothetical protein